MKVGSSAFTWFGNDADGLSIIDLLASGMFIFFLLCKVVHVVLVVVFISNEYLVEQLGTIFGDVNENMYIVVTAYFVKKTIDTSITKIGLFKTDSYVSPSDIGTEQYIAEEVDQLKK